MERVYIADWLYNAGIVGFLRALGGHDIENGKLLDASGREIKGVEIGDNYFEFDREVVRGYTERFLRLAAEKYCRSENIDVTKFEKEQIENFTKRWLDKGFHHSNFTRDFLNNLKKAEEFVLNPPSIFTIGGGKRKIAIPCVVCMDRHSKNNLRYTTAVSNISGFNKDNLNLVHFYVKSKQRQLPICEICNIIFLSASLGFTSIESLRIDRDTTLNKFVFVNNNASVEELFRDNEMIDFVLNKKEENPLIKFFTEKLVFTHEKTSPLTLNGISVISLGIQLQRKGGKNNYTIKAKNFNVSYEKARLFTQEKLTESLRKLSKASLKLKEGRGSRTVNILEKVVTQLLTDSISFTFIYKLFRYYLKDRNNKNKPSSDVEVYFNPFQIFQILNTYFQYLKLFGGGSMKTLEERELRQAWRKGKELRSFFEDARQENKIDSIAFKLLNALRTSNYPRFMDILLRVYAGFSKEVPYFLVKGAQNPEIFQLLGYSFVAGFLGEEKNSSEREEE